MTASDHLTIDQVRAYVRGALHPSTLVATDDHLEACAACRAALARESDASFGAEAFGRALATAEARPESPHLSFDHLRSAVDGTLSPVDRAWVDAHVRLCMMCAEELRDLERFAATLPARPTPIPPPGPPVGTPLGAAAAPEPYVSPRRRPEVALEGVPDEPPSHYGERPPVPVPLWIKIAAGVSLAAILQLWAC